MNNADMPAMPQDADWKNDMESSLNSSSGAPSFDGIGLTKREQFAAMAMQGLLANSRSNVAYWAEVNGANDIATISTNYADALLKALEGES